ncbi:MAG: hypothetical protein MZU95_04945 [Desulfomicrobium escambiense]|nr:hypothetical protein [Desulfomicrobium escambiense]
MKAVWNKGGEATISNVLQAVNASRINKVKRATIRVQMRRLKEASWLANTSLP